MQPIIRRKVRILRPFEYELLQTGLKPLERIQFEGLLFTGMRYIEAIRFQEHPEWLDDKFIRLPEGSVKKKKTEFDERTIILSNMGRKRVPFFLKDNAKLSVRGSWDWILKERAKKVGLDPKGICAKTTRKTWESWLIDRYKNNTDLIAGSQGHTGTTQTKHYLGLGFYPEDSKGMERYVKGWI
jgi:integrase